MNFCLSASLSESASTLHCFLSISCSIFFFSASYWAWDSLALFYQDKMLRVSWTFSFFSWASLLSLAIFFSWSSIQSLAYTYSSTIFSSIFCLLSMSYFSLSNWVQAVMKWVSSLRRSSVSILNLRSIAFWTIAAFSAFLCSVMTASLSAICYLTCSGVSMLARNSASNIWSSLANKLASFYLLALRSVCALRLMSAILFLATCLMITFSVFYSHLAFKRLFLSPLIWFYNWTSLCINKKEW